MYEDIPTSDDENVEEIDAVHNDKDGGNIGAQARNSTQSREKQVNMKSKPSFDEVIMKDTWYTNGVSIVSDGWSNVRKNPPINILAINSRGAMFLYMEDYFRIEKSGINIAELLLETIDKVGPSNAIQVVTNNAVNCKLAGKEVEKELMKSGDEHTRDVSALITGYIGSDYFWDEVYNIVAITKPNYKLISHSAWYMGKNECLYESLGFALSPRFYDSTYVSTHAPGRTIRKKPNEDKEVVAGVLKAFEKIASHLEEARMLRK
ncbi:hypothetical protein ACSBR1_017793 [Camellia fascicularis]